MRTLAALALSALLLTGSATAALADDGSGMARPAAPSTEQFNDDGSGMSLPTTPTNTGDYERWA